MQTVTPLDPAAKALAETSSEALLDSMVQLTHMIHAIGSEARANELREQRAMVRAELLSRLPGGAR